MKEMQGLSEGQKIFTSAVRSGRNIFLTGKAGSGKSHVVKYVMEQMKFRNKKFVAVAPTGIAANNIKGQTIHSMFQINPFGIMDFEACSYMNNTKRRIIEAAEVFIIDEVSMLRPDILDAMNWTLLKNKIGKLSDKQIIFVGDMKQLQVIIDDNTKSVLYSREYKGHTFRDALCFEELDVLDIELDEVLRQSDPEFIENLNIIREGGKSPYFKQFVSIEFSGIVLAPHNSTVQDYNVRGLEKIDSEVIEFRADFDGKARAGEFPADPIIHVKQGARIMYLVNSKSDNDLINGTLGIFKEKDGKYFITVGKNDYQIKRHEFTKKEYVLDYKTGNLELMTVGTMKQYPIRLAYALSIHKSQGLTFDEVTVDLSAPCFAEGQLYVALSRVKSPEGLKIIV